MGPGPAPELRAGKDTRCAVVSVLALTDRHPCSGKASIVSYSSGGDKLKMGPTELKSSGRRGSSS